VIDYRDDSAGGPEANCEAHLRFSTAAGPVEGWIRYSKTARLPGGLVVRTDRGTVLLEDRDDAPIVFRPHGEPELEHVIRTRHAVAQEDTFMLQLEDFVNACRNGHAPRVDGAAALASMRLIESLYARRRPWPPAAEAAASLAQGADA
jgi:predicted dehydrogenase